MLKHIFTPEQARVAAFLDYRFQSLEEIYEKHASSAYAKEDLKQTLDQIASKGGIGFRNRDGQYFYCNMPLVVGMYEYQTNRLTPEFVADFERYIGIRTFM